MQKCLQDQIGNNVHVYVDDVIIKTKESRTLIDYLGFLVSSRGSEENPDKIRAIERMQLP
jgi:hypothetical protein